MAADPAAVDRVMQESITPEMYKNWRQLCDFFGTPRVMPTMTQLRAKDVWDYFEMFTGTQTEMSDAVHKDFKQNVQFPLDVFPMVEIEGDEIEWVHFLLESQVMDESTEQMPNTILEATMVKDSAVMVSKGLSFTMNADFIFSENGQDLFHQYCRGLEKCVANTMGDDILKTIRRTAVQNHLEKLGHPQNVEQFHRMLQALVAKFAIFQKQRDGVSIVQSECAETLDAQDLQADLEINPAGATRYHEYLDPQRNTASIGGDNLTPKAYQTDRVVQYVKQFPKIRSQQSRTFKQPKNLPSRDPFYRTVVVGGHTVSFDIVTPSVGIEKYRSAHRDVVIGDSLKVTARKTLAEIVKNSMIWDAAGALTTDGKHILRSIVRHVSGDADFDADDSKDYTVDLMLEHAGLKEKVITFCQTSDDGKVRFAKYRRAAAAVPLAEGGDAKAPVEFPQEFTLRAVNALIAADLPVPLGFILSRHNQAMIAGCYVQCQAAGSGMIAENRWMMDLMKNTKQRKLGVNLNYSAKCVIKKRQNYIFVPDVFVRNIVYGMGTKFYGPADQTARSPPGAKDIHVLAVPYNFQLENNWNDITGQVHSDMLQAPALGETLTYPTALEYRTIWGWANTPTNLFQEAYWSPTEGEPQPNTLTLQEWQRYCVPKELDTGVQGAEILGMHWIGDKIYPSTYRALRGEDSFMQQALYEPKQVAVSQ